MQRNGINNPDSIYVGQPLQIPVVETSSESASIPAVEEASSAPKSVGITSLNRTYTVRSGDTLPWIALRLGLDLSALRAINNLNEGQAIRLGQQLILPATEDELRVKPALLRHTVRAGESLGLIAQAHNTSLSALMAINRITNPDIIQPGQELVIPNPAQAQRAPEIGPARSGFYYHDVRPGETLSQLAAQYNTTPQAIVRYNNLPNIETIFSGLEVRIPFGPPVLHRQTPQAPRSGTEFVISISRQRCWVFQGDRIRHEWKCSTGQGEWVTRTGTFYVKTKMEMAKSRAYQLDMPYWLGLYDVGSYENGIHGIPIDWTTGERLWDTLVGQPATFGCAMLLDEDAALLFDLAYIGMPVHIVD
jgi:LysM repeat protein